MELAAISSFVPFLPSSCKCHTGIVSAVKQHIRPSSVAFWVSAVNRFDILCGYLLYRLVLVDRKRGSNPRRLGKHHEDRLHPDRTIGDVAGRQTYRDQQVTDFISLRHNGSVGNRKR